MNLKVTGALVAFSAVGFLAASPAVQAVNWGTVTSTYDGRVRVEGRETTTTIGASTRRTR